MPDERDRFRSLDAIPAPDLWAEVRLRVPSTAVSTVDAPAAARQGGRKLFGHRWLRLPLVAAPLAAILVAGSLLTAPPPSALAVIDAAQRSFERIAPFTITVSSRVSGDVLRSEMPDYDRGDMVAEWRIAYAGQHAWRRDVVRQEPAMPEILGGDAGSYWVWDGTALGIYEHGTNEFRMQPVVAGFDPLGELSWSIRGSWCDESEVLRDVMVAGRAARHVRCDDEELWIDAQTGLLLRIASSGFHYEVVAIEYEPTFPPDAFVVAPPSGARTGPSDVPLVPGLKVGVAAPAWSGPQVGGGILDLSLMGGQPVLVFLWADWCDSACSAVFPLMDELTAGYASRVHVVGIDVSGNAERAAEWLAKELDGGAWSFPIAIDDGRISRDWKVVGVPAWVLLDGDGVVVSVRAGGSQTIADLRTMLETVLPT